MARSTPTVAADRLYAQRLTMATECLETAPERCSGAKASGAISADSRHLGDAAVSTHRRRAYWWRRRRERRIASLELSKKTGSSSSGSPLCLAGSRPATVGLRHRGRRPADSTLQFLIKEWGCRRQTGPFIGATGRRLERPARHRPCISAATMSTAPMPGVSAPVWCGLLPPRTGVFRGQGLLRTGRCRIVGRAGADSAHHLRTHQEASGAAGFRHRQNTLEVGGAVPGAGSTPKAGPLYFHARMDEVALAEDPPDTIERSGRLYTAGQPKRKDSKERRGPIPWGLEGRMYIRDLGTLGDYDVRRARVPNRDREGAVTQPIGVGLALRSDPCRPILFVSLASHSPLCGGHKTRICSWLRESGDVAAVQNGVANGAGAWRPKHHTAKPSLLAAMNGHEDVVRFYPRQGRQPTESGYPSISRLCWRL